MYSFTERNKIHKWKRERRIGNTREEERKDGNTGKGGREGKEEMKGDETMSHIHTCRVFVLSGGTRWDI